MLRWLSSPAGLPRCSAETDTKLLCVRFARPEAAVRAALRGNSTDAMRRVGIGQTELRKNIPQSL